MYKNILVENISVKFGSNVIYESAKLELKQNTITQFSAPSGSGKTVLVRYLIDQNELKIAYSPQNSILISHLYPLEFISLVLSANEQKVDKSRVLKKLAKYEIPVHTVIRNLSNGQKSRLQVLLTILIKADLYVLDEPFASLDSKNIKKMIELIRENPKTFLIINHQTDFLANEDQLIKVGNQLRLEERN
jgi:ABC-type multidrug transport system ATPase subunit